MKIIALSDVHGHVKHLKEWFERTYVCEDDILVIAGDIVHDRRQIPDVDAFLRGIPIPRERRLLVLGNHDGPNARSCGLTEARIIDGDLVELDDITFLGVPFYPTPEFFERMNCYQGKVDVLVSHRPPRGILDRVSSQRAGGTQSILDLVMSLRPIVHIFGHIHAHGVLDDPNRALFINAAICDPSITPLFEPTVLDIAYTPFGPWFTMA